MEKARTIKVGAYEALVDASDFKRLSQRRWFYSHGYATRREQVNGKKTTRYMHREVLGMSRGDNKRDYADHINGNKLDNRRRNLRIVSKAENSSCRKLRKDNKSGFKGVFYCYNGWMAQITVRGKSVYLGRFKTAKEAAVAYDKAAVKAFGDLAMTNAKLACT